MKALAASPRQPEQPDHHRRRGALEHGEAAEAVERPEDERAEHEERQRLAQVPLDARERLHRDVRRPAGRAAAAARA